MGLVVAACLAAAAPPAAAALLAAVDSQAVLVERLVEVGIVAAATAGAVEVQQAGTENRPAESTRCLTEGKPSQHK